MKRIFAVNLWLGLLLLLAPTGCQKPDPTPIIRDRAQQLLVCLFKEQYDDCLKFCDPIYVRAQGSEKIKGQLKFLSVIFKIAKITDKDIRIETVNVFQDGKTAEVIPSLQVKNEWKPQKPMKWRFEDGQWYLAF